MNETDRDLFGDEIKGEYDAFVEKFKPKKTTDDCYTPGPVYDAVAGWVAEEYGVDPGTFCRPFCPGGDYKSEDYTGKIVVDNPPFSLSAEILRFYRANGVRFFLFAPGLTLSSGDLEGVTFIAAGCDIVYANGAEVRTGFSTDLDDPSVVLRSAPELTRRVKAAVDAANTAKQTPKYVYPDHIVTAAMVQSYSQRGIGYKVRRRECVQVSVLDAQRRAGKKIFGKGLLLSDRAAAERAAAERAAAERAAAERAAATVWELSDRECAIVDRLNGAEETPPLYEMMEVSGQ